MGSAFGSLANGENGKGRGSDVSESEVGTSGDCVDYQKGAEYWAQCDATIDAMLGGFSRISGKDIEGSQEFLSELFMVRPCFQFQLDMCFNFKTILTDENLAVSEDCLLVLLQRDFFFVRPSCDNLEHSLGMKVHCNTVVTMNGHTAT
jgi:hypothetical protein